MKIKVTYCQPCRFYPQVLKDLGDIYTLANKQIDGVELIAGTDGVYDIEIDGQLVFSKDEKERFPEKDELERIVKPKLEA